MLFFLTGTLIPLRDVLKNYLEIPGMFSAIHKYVESLQNESKIFNVVQSSFWKERTGSRRDILPLYFYFDEYEVGNALGSHKGIHKLGAVYVKLACIPPALSSSLENILMFSLFHASDKKEFTNKSVFFHNIKELDYLESIGVLINVDNVEHRVFFQLSGILGDNLGLNSILGYSEGFSAIHFCRLCTANSTQTGKMVTENKNLLRNSVNYENQVNVNDAKTTGIKERCVFNDISSFYVTENYVVDIMHDLFEGVCGYDLILILKHCISENHFTLNMLNNAILFFNYDNCDNRPPPISELEFAKGSISMSSSEMIFFVKNLSFMVGAHVPQKDEFWKLYLLLRQIVILVLNNYVNDKLINLLELLIEKHHKLYLKLSKSTLKPKYHFMVHYSSIMRQVGPLKEIWCMRYESKHRQSKLSSNVVASRVNITKTLAIKNQLKLAHTFLSGIDFRPISYYDSDPSNDYTKVDKITVYGTKYATNGVISLESSESFFLYNIAKIIVLNKSQQVFFLCKNIIYTFDKRFQAYKIMSISEEKKIISHSELVTFAPFNKIIINNHIYIPYESFNNFQ